MLLVFVQPWENQLWFLKLGWNLLMKVLRSAKWCYLIMISVVDTVAYPVCFSSSSLLTEAWFHYWGSLLSWIPTASSSVKPGIEATWHKT